MSNIKYLDSLRVFQDMLEKQLTDVEWMEDHPFESGAFFLWDILTAFRGPDQVDDLSTEEYDQEHYDLIEDIKNCTTMRVREWIRQLVDPDDKDYRHQRAGNPKYTPSQVSEVCGYHFTSHLRSAESVIQMFDPQFQVFKTEKSGG